MIKLKASELTVEALERLRGASIGERVVIARDGEPPLEFVRKEPEPRRGGFDLDEWRAALKRHGIKPDPPEEVAAMKAALLDSSLSCRLLGVDPD